MLCVDGAAVENLITLKLDACILRLINIKLYRGVCVIKADVCSTGVILHILLSGVPPFWAETEEEMFGELLHTDLNFSSDPWPKISEGAKDLVRRMLIRGPKKRLTVHEVLCHLWVMTDDLAPNKPLDHSVVTRLQQFSAMNKLTKMALRVTAERLSEEEIAGLKEMF